MSTPVSSLERVKAALEHKEMDRIPFDIGSSVVTGIHDVAYANLRQYLGLPLVQQTPVDPRQKLAEIDDDIREKLGIDFISIKPKLPLASLKFGQEGDYVSHIDEWGIGWQLPKGGPHFCMRKHPMAEIDTLEGPAGYTFPDPENPVRFAGMAEEARSVMQDQEKAYVLGRMSAGILEVALWLRGFENFYTDLLINKKFAEALLDKLTEIKLKYWAKALDTVGENVLVALECDDLGEQNSLLISPKTYREMIKPRHTEIFSFIKKRAKSKIYVLYHSCGAIKPLIPDFIESGVDALHPVQVSASGMDTQELKREFGKDISFWGGGIDTQAVLSFGTPQQVKDEVKRRIEDLAPGGGFVFATVHNIEAEVPPQNLIAMWEAVKEYGKY